MAFVSFSEEHQEALCITVLPVDIRLFAMFFFLKLPIGQYSMPGTNRPVISAANLSHWLDAIPYHLLYINACGREDVQDLKETTATASE
jgi:hypothetical protein